MKKVGEYTARGTVVGNGYIKLQLFDGQFDTGFRVTEFRVFGDPNAESGADAYGLLSTIVDPGIADGGDWQWEDNNQIGWAATTYSGAGATVSEYNLVDPDNLIIEDLYVYGRVGGGASAINYFITFEKYDITEWRGALQLVRNSSQG